MIHRKATVGVILSIACFWYVAGLQGQATGSVSWEKVTADAGFHVRDSAGEVVYDGKMWIMGGWYDSTQTSLRDVWSSTDGVHWTCATAQAPWVHGEHPVALAFDNKMWVMSGWCNGRCPTPTPATRSGIPATGPPGRRQRRRALDCPNWGRRRGLDGKMWILGGVQGYGNDDTNTPLNDVWSSSNGVDWQQATAHAPWSGRGFHQVLAYNNKLWVLGGGNYYLDRSERVGSNDVWSSADGVSWTQATEHAPWDARLWHAAIVYDNAMWILGGCSGGYSPVNFDDVWRSTDGTNWTQVTADVIWSARHEQSVYDFQNRLWVVAGNGSLNDVWRSGIAAPEPARAFAEHRPARPVGTYLCGEDSGFWP